MQPQTPICRSSFASPPNANPPVSEGTIAPKVAFGTICCTPFQHCSPKVAFSCGTSAKSEGRKCRRPTRKRYFWRKVLEGSANNDVLTSKIIKNRLWALWGSFGVVWGSLGRPWEGCGETLGTFGETLGGFWKTLGGFGEALGRLWEALGRLWEDFPTDRPTARPTIYSNSRSTAPAASY